MPEPSEAERRLREAVYAGVSDALKWPRLPFHEFLRKSWEVVEPKTPMLDNWHIGYLCEHLEAVSLGQITRLLINIPPRWMKSTIVTIAWPAWEWGPHGRPDLRYMFVSYDQDLSTTHSLARRRILKSDWYQQSWGKRVVLCGDQDRKTVMENTWRGMMISTSTHGRATGMGGNRLVLDDFINPKMVESEIERESAFAQYDKTYVSRLNNKLKDAIVVVEQRLHVQDFTAKLMAEKGYTHIVIPSDNFKKEPMFFSFPRSGTMVEVPPGAAIWPSREPMSIIAAERARGPSAAHTHDAQSRQNPSAASGAIFARHLWKFYTKHPEKIDPLSGKWVLTNWDDLIQSWDCTFKDSPKSDYVVGQVWGRIGANRYLLDQTRAQLDLPATMEAIISMTQKWPRAHRKLIEDKANGPAVMQMLAKKIPGLIAVNPQGGKRVRAKATQPFQEAGNIFLPSPTIAPWTNDFISRAEQFTGEDGGVHDDEVDAMTQANIYFTSSAVPGLSIVNIPGAR